MDNLINSPLDKELQRLSPFELKNRLINMADQSVRKAANTMLNAGRGNPNWIATEPRLAFYTFGYFAMEEAKRVLNLPEGIAGVPVAEGIASRFEAWMKANPSLPGMDLLRNFYEYMLLQDAVEPDALLQELASAINGDDYPTPPRILPGIEKICRDYLTWAICDGQAPEKPFDLFAVEGSTAGMCYCFDVLQQNFLLGPGDNVAMLVPIFTPYIEIPQLREFDFNVTNIYADTRDAEGVHTWNYNPEDLAILRDPKYKMLFMVNPTNPPSYALDSTVIDAILDALKYNPNLMILTDDVYGTFVPGYKSIIASAPFNSMSCYSFSKYFGATGWRLSVTAVAPDNIYDKLLRELPDDKKAILNKRYSSLTIDVPSLKFIDRMVAESRLVALNHTSGLSTPQQVQMALMAVSSLVDKKGVYKTRLLQLIHDRYNALWKAFGFEMPPDPLRADYYSEIDLLVWAKKMHGQAFADYLDKTYSPLATVFRMAQEAGTVVLNGGGFDGPKWSIRVSLANCTEDDFTRLGASLRRILEQYAAEWQASLKQS